MAGLLPLLPSLTRPPVRLAVRLPACRLDLFDIRLGTCTYSLKMTKREFRRTVPRGLTFFVWMFRRVRANSGGSGTLASSETVAIISGWLEAQRGSGSSSSSNNNNNNNSYDATPRRLATGPAVNEDL